MGEKRLGAGRGKLEVIEVPLMSGFVFLYDFIAEKKDTAKL
ncbi:hypothetical protein [Chryseobacterium sp. StRB126]|nr:hypothetical protein [Chryseobacterium sp. StRB126]